MSRKVTFEDFTKRYIAKFGDNFEIDENEYVNTNTPISVKCKICGYEFIQTPSNFLRTVYGCPKCGTENRNIKNHNKILSNGDFIERANKIHNNKYDYSKVDMNNRNMKGQICIICPEHGEFWQLPQSHLRGYGCAKCAGKHRYTTEEWIKQAEIVHNFKYDYFKSVYENKDKKVCIICHQKDEYGFEHGEFWQNASSHLQGVGCPKCSKKYKTTTDEFKQLVSIIHHNTYDCSKLLYKNRNTKVTLTCSIHGDFTINPYSLIIGKGCPKCNGIFHYTTDEWIEKAKIIHCDKYDYSKVDYKLALEKVCIICPEHGEFWQTPSKHINGQGCPKCNSSHLERDIRLLLEENRLKFQEQKTFHWLINKGNLKLDFYLPDCNIAIECQGIQHFQPIDFSDGKQTKSEVYKNFLENQKRDVLKRKLCQENSVMLLYYSNLGIHYPYNVFEDKQLLLNKIKNERNNIK